MYMYIQHSEQEVEVILDKCIMLFRFLQDKVQCTVYAAALTANTACCSLASKHSLLFTACCSLASFPGSHFWHVHVHVLHVHVYTYMYIACFYLTFDFALAQKISPYVFLIQFKSN